MPYRNIHSGNISKNYYGTDLFSIVVNGGRAITDLADIHHVKPRLERVS